MKTKGTIEQRIAKLKRSIHKFGNTELKSAALRALIKSKEKQNDTRTII